MELLALLANPGLSTALRGVLSAPVDGWPASSSVGAASVPRQRQVRLSDAQVTDLVNDYVGGMTFKQLCDRYGVSETTVRMHLRRRQAPRRPYRKLYGETLDRAIELHASGRSLRSIAAELDLSPDTVRLGLKGRGRQQTLDGGGIRSSVTDT